ncbi:GNAT family N-acetyltransferase [Chloroflexota bacterium]
MEYTVRALSEDEWPLWDDFVDKSSSGTLFHKRDWFDVSGEKFIIYGYFRGQELYAGIPLSIKSMFGIKVACRPGLTPYNGVLFKQREGKYVTKLSSEKEEAQALAHLMKSDFKLVRFGFSPGHVDLQPFIREGFLPEIMYTYVIKLGASLEDIWNGLGENTRRNIKKARKDGITIIQSDDFNQTLSLVEKTFSRQNLKGQSGPLAFRYNAMLSKRGQCKSFVAKDRNDYKIAVVYIIWDTSRAYYMMGGYDSEKSHYGAMSLAMWEAIEYSRQELSLKEFDFEGSMIPQIERFFRAFGGKLSVRYIVTWAAPYLKIPFLLRKR